MKGFFPGELKKHCVVLRHRFYGLGDSSVVEHRLGVYTQTLNSTQEKKIEKLARCIPNSFYEPTGLSSEHCHISSECSSDAARDP